MPDLNGVRVSIFCNDQPLEEYEATYEGDTVTCWIPSEVGKVRAQGSLPLSVDRAIVSGRVFTMRNGQVLTIASISDV